MLFVDFALSDEKIEILVGTKFSRMERTEWHKTRRVKRKRAPRQQQPRLRTATQIPHYIQSQRKHSDEGRQGQGRKARHPSTNEYISSRRGWESH